jgi:uncharacterized protein (DUF302 family)
VNHLVLGILLGALLALAVVALVLRARAAAWMLPEKRSALGLDDTVKRLSETAQAAGWIVQSIVELEKSILKNGGGTVRPVRLVNLCQAQHAAEIMRDDTARRVSVLMPCTIAVYEKSDGRIWVAAMNPGLIAPLFGGVVARVMGGPVAAEQLRFLDALSTP